MKGDLHLDEVSKEYDDKQEYRAMRNRKYRYDPKEGDDLTLESEENKLEAELGHMFRKETNKSRENEQFVDRWRYAVKHGETEGEIKL